VGNIYADEALFRARLHPLRPAGSIGPREARRLYEAVRETLRLGIDHEGSSVESFVDPAGGRGHFQEILNVYQRDGEPCRSCGASVRRIVVGGRSTHFCPRCQPRRHMQLRTNRRRSVAGGERSGVVRTAERGSARGARLYVVATRVPRRERIAVGALGDVDLRRGWYAYIGSAQRGRDARVARHRQTGKPLRWHADYLFDRHPATLAWTLDVPGEADDGAEGPAECRLAALLATFGRVAGRRFGASDCGCPGHLVEFDSRSTLVAAVSEAAFRLGAEAVVH
jgi:Uri superfamily endonuclease